MMEERAPEYDSQWSQITNNDSYHHAPIFVRFPLISIVESRGNCKFLVERKPTRGEMCQALVDVAQPANNAPSLGPNNKSAIMFGLSHTSAY